MQEPTSPEHDAVWKAYSLGLCDISRSYGAISISGIWDSICHIVEQMMDIHIERVILDICLWSDGVLCIKAPSLMPQHPGRRASLDVVCLDWTAWRLLLVWSFDFENTSGALWITFCNYSKVKNPIATLGLKHVSLQVKKFKYNELGFKTDRLGQHSQGSRQCTYLTWWRYGWSKV